MKKIAFVFLALSAMVGAFIACGGDVKPASDVTNAAGSAANGASSSANQAASAANSATK